MKTAVSLPDPIFEEAEALAKRLQLSRSELYLKALKAYLKRHNQAQTLKQLHKVYTEEDSKPDPAMSKMQLMSLEHEDW